MTYPLCSSVTAGDQPEPALPCTMLSSFVSVVAGRPAHSRAGVPPSPPCPAGAVRGGAESGETIRTHYLPPADFSSPFALLFTLSRPTLSLPSLLFVRPPVPVPAQKEGPPRVFPQVGCHPAGKDVGGGPRGCPRAARWRFTRTRHESPPGPARAPTTPPPRIPLGDGNGQFGAPRPGSGGPGREATEVVGNKERLARVAVHAVPPHPLRGRRGTGVGWRPNC